MGAGGGGTGAGSGTGGGGGAIGAGGVGSVQHGGASWANTWVGVVSPSAKASDMPNEIVANSTKNPTRIGLCFL